MDGRICRRAYARGYSARRKLLPAPGLDVVLPAGISEQPARQVIADGAEHRSCGNSRVSLDVYKRQYPESAYVRDILDQPRAIRDTIAVLAESEELNDFTKGLSATRYQSIVLTGMGNSFHILTPLYLKLIELGFSVLMAETSELIHFMPRLLGNRTVLIVVSQSGRSGEIVRLLSMKGEGATILGVTNDPTSPLAMESDVVALIQAGPEASVACKTTTASLAALAWIGEYMATTDLSSTKDRCV